MKSQKSRISLSDTIANELNRKADLQIREMGEPALSNTFRGTPREPLDKITGQTFEFNLQANEIEVMP